MIPGMLEPLPITSVEVAPLTIPMTRPISSALGTYTSIEGVSVFIHTDGPSGFGFNLGLGGKPAGALAAYVQDELVPLAMGADARAPEALWHRLWAPNKARIRGGLGAWALSAVDVACWDVAAKAASIPLHSMLGGYRTTVPVYGSGGWHSLSDAELVAEAERFASQGIRAYKYKVGSPHDLRRTAALRQAMGDDFTLLADGNQGFTVRTALETAAMLADHGVAWLEEPVLADTVDDLAEVAASSPVPVAAGENAYFRWGFRHLCERRAASFLQPDVVRCGGVTEFRRIAALAESFGLALSSHLWHELSITVVGASPAGWMAEYTDLVPPETWTRQFPVVDGCIEVPRVPGHGLELA